MDSGDPNIRARSTGAARNNYNYFEVNSYQDEWDATGLALGEPILQILTYGHIMPLIGGYGLCINRRVFTGNYLCSSR